jgi:dGTPase
MPDPENPRFVRLSGKSAKKPKDCRTDGQIDRDRLLYCTAFRRLAEITQVAHAGEGHQFHNRLTHVLKVAQIGRRIAERILTEDKGKWRDLAERLGGLDPDVVEAAGLAHDMGHPPFGHVAETELSNLAKKDEDIGTEGFEGNAQSFRIVTKLAVRSAGEGLDLTRATLNAILKYPWRQQPQGREHKKWGVYREEEQDFEKARTVAPFKNSKTLEAEIMDWADDVAYAVYDLDDFYRARLIPFDKLLQRSKSHLDYFFDDIRMRWTRDKKAVDTLDAHRTQFEKLLEIFESRHSLKDTYVGSSKQRGELRDITSNWVNRYAGALSLAQKVGSKEPACTGFVQGTPPVEIPDGIRQEVTILKELAWTYVIETSSLKTQQEGQKAIIHLLFKKFKAAADRDDWSIFPGSIRADLNKNPIDWSSKKVTRTRIVIDLIASMTEIQAVEMYHRLTGQSFGSITQGIIR